MFQRMHTCSQVRSRKTPHGITSSLITLFLINSHKRCMPFAQVLARSRSFSLVLAISPLPHLDFIKSRSRAQIADCISVNEWSGSQTSGDRSKASRHIGRAEDVVNFSADAWPAQRVLLSPAVVLQRSAQDKGNPLPRHSRVRVQCERGRNARATTGRAARASPTLRNVTGTVGLNYRRH